MTGRDVNIIKNTRLSREWFSGVALATPNPMQHRFLCVILFALALAPKINESKKLCFDSNGSFKIAQFADRKCVIIITHTVGLHYSTCTCVSITGEMSMPILNVIPKWFTDPSVHFGEGENTVWGPQQDVVIL